MCEYVCACVCEYVCACVRVFGCASASVRKCVCVNVRKCVFARTHVHVLFTIVCVGVGSHTPHTFHLVALVCSTAR